MSQVIECATWVVDACAAGPAMPERYRLAVTDTVWKCRNGTSMKGTVNLLSAPVHAVVLPTEFLVIRR